MKMCFTFRKYPGERDPRDEAPCKKEQEWTKEYDEFKREIYALKTRLVLTELLVEAAINYINKTPFVYDRNKIKWINERWQSLEIWENKE